MERKLRKRDYKDRLLFAIAVLMAVFFTWHFGPTHSNDPDIPPLDQPFVYGGCRSCVPLSGTGVPIENDRGEYLDYVLVQKLEKLKSLNNTWHITEAYPPTVRHLSFCHYNGTCVDIALYKNRVTPKTLDQLCRDALKAGLTVLNEYSKPILPQGSACPLSNIFETTTGGNLHLSY